MNDLQPGKRVVVRYALHPGDTHATSDALGVIRAVDEQSVEISTKQGPVRVERTRILVVHEVPPAPTRAGRTHRVVSAVDLRRISAAAWLPADSSWLQIDNLREEVSDADSDLGLLSKGWLLRSSDSATQRANSALPVTDTGLGWEQSLDAVEAWYATRDKPARVQIYSADPSTALAPECAGLAPLLSARGYNTSESTLLLTGATKEAAGEVVSPRDAAAPGLVIDVSDRPTETHFAVWASQRDPGSAQAFRALIEADQPCSVVTAYAPRADGSRSLVATSRIVERNKWGVMTNLVTHPELRRRGAGRSVIRAAAAMLAQRGVRSYLVDVESSNAASLALFESLGASVQHRSWYATQRQG
ncbi:GNAT family N-acetyltransferase [Microbacterium esteraromaticum]|uniref:GNAT family N-acetyltransferase n=1 Tax=Microbacterium esteraromaticum TaxID=57043 RepID=UPI001CD2EC53|nr:GNAT family N-acetyltransferase [Microbacterium esteraromaticum]MCA1307136.1 GNAT family N-acetyltransferase [Microbacterium esteraromaticum]